jgi:hypothetical protein
MIAIQQGPVGARAGNRRAPALTAVQWLYLAASPTFAVMALLTALLDRGAVSMLCSPAQGMSALTGMVPMYLLMSVFHLAPWLRLIGSRAHG